MFVTVTVTNGEKENKIHLDIFFHLTDLENPGMMQFFFENSKVKSLDENSVDASPSHPLRMRGE